ncbi:hypothetical protein [Sphingomonas sp. NFR15]|uniref:hypothetical protein n=1 Tax=Sphingomonas sp. NFR15 TaxID=1566282 RepID=UPI00088FB7A3|nr:hypothetical protein [Sphingomonas sp. NFR15]SDA21710.1 hypothetical protein SAMN03159340_01484 [Sphingomonas sp. NFR15]
MDVATQNAYRALIRVLVSSGALSGDDVSALAEDLKSVAKEAFDQNYDVDGGQLQNVAVDIAADYRTR